MSSQVVNGKAFEWATALAISDALSVEILESPEAEVAKSFYEQISQELRDRFIQNSSLGVEHILHREAKSDVLKGAIGIRLAKDSTGQKGDVRDVVITSENAAEIGISCKTNHSDFKHPRLSDRIDFVKQWGLSPDGCSKEYWNTVRPIFLQLREIRQQSEAKALWSELPNKHTDIYLPILTAFEKELHRLTDIHSTNSKIASQALAKYTIGSNDFYKLISESKGVKIQAFNMNGSLAGKKTSLPEFMLGTDDLDGSKESITVRMNKGYAFNFRLHNASSRVEPSLKFAVSAAGLPPGEIYQNHLEANLYK